MAGPVAPFHLNFSFYLTDPVGRFRTKVPDQGIQRPIVFGQHPQGAVVSQDDGDIRTGLTLGGSRLGCFQNLAGPGCENVRHVKSYRLNRVGVEVGLGSVAID